MKKIITLFAILFTCGALLSAGSWTHYAGFGWNLPMELSVNADSYKNGEEVVFENQTGLELSFLGISENKIAVKAAGDINWTGINHIINNVPFKGLNLNLQIGAGYAPVCTERFTLAVLAMTGFDASKVFSKSSFYDPGFDDLSITEYSQKYLTWMFGGNIDAIFAVNGNLSVYTSFSAYYLTKGLYNEKADRESKVYVSEDDDYTTNGTVKFIPTIGVCWKF